MAVIGIDVGGTKTSGILLHDGSIAARTRAATDTGSSDTVLKGILETISSLMEKASSLRLKVEAVGLGMAGFIDARRGVVTEAPNLPVKDLPVRDILRRETGLPVYVDNDANAAGLAEATLGAGKGLSYLVHLTLGTGIGGAVIINGKVYRGSLGSAAELGHMIIKEGGPPCNCGARGCLEALASGVAIYRQVERLASMNVDSPMVEDFMKDPLAFEAGDVCRHADEGDPFALSVLRDAGRYLGIGIATLINIFNPDAVTLSGGLLGCFHHMEEEMKREVRESAIPISGKHARVLRGTLGEDTGPLGAALLTRESTTR